MPPPAPRKAWEGSHRLAQRQDPWLGRKALSARCRWPCPRGAWDSAGLSSTSSLPFPLGGPKRGPLASSSTLSHCLPQPGLHVLWSEEPCLRASFCATLESNCSSLCNTFSGERWKPSGGRGIQREKSQGNDDEPYLETLWDQRPRTACLIQTGLCGPHDGWGPDSAAGGPGTPFPTHLPLPSAK